MYAFQPGERLKSRLTTRLLGTLNSGFSSSIAPGVVVSVDEVQIIPHVAEFEHAKARQVKLFVSR